MTCVTERQRLVPREHRREIAKQSATRLAEKRSESSRQYRLKNPDKVKAGKAAYRARHSEREREKAREYKQREAGRLKEWSAAYKRENKGRINAANRARVAHIKRATPPWANLDAIEQMYIEAAQLGMHVDHVIPLRGKFVSGLHVENNLQLLPPVENHRKYNKVTLT